MSDHEGKALLDNEIARKAIPTGFDCLRRGP